ncbi:hypothetical protein Q2T69_04785 [Klebsiella oxytoca]|uniref:hypothetical protein n=1 Tax=Klebsiella oxytoca TaxID=571 RepID=UPI00265DBE21|nr:hypothetical protein [Klebsiella oxytoca]WKM78433.1 hypothetical protein Q2T69_04785 [Klebsiella oxytoca]
MAEVPLPTPTQAPVPSTDIRNAVFAGAKLDEEVTGTGDFYTDRFGVKHLTNNGRSNQFQQFLLSSGYVFLGDYEDGPYQFGARNQYIRYDNQYYRLNASTDVGFTTTGTNDASFQNDVTHFVLMDGDTLRQNLAASSGLSLIGGLGYVTPQMYGAIPGSSTVDNTVAMQSAINAASGKVLDLRGGPWRVSATLDFTSLRGIITDYTGRILVNPVGFSALHSRKFAVTFGNPDTPFGSNRCNHFTCIGYLLVESDNRDAELSGVYIKGALMSFGSIRATRFNGHGLRADAWWDSSVASISYELCGNTSLYALDLNPHGDTSNCLFIGRIQVEQAYHKQMNINIIRSVIGSIHSERLKILTLDDGTTGLPSGLTYQNTNINITNTTIGQMILDAAEDTAAGTVSVNPSVRLNLYESEVSSFYLATSVVSSTFGQNGVVKSSSFYKYYNPSYSVTMIGCRVTRTAGDGLAVVGGSGFLALNCTFDTFTPDYNSSGITLQKCTINATYNSTNTGVSGVVFDQTTFNGNVSGTGPTEVSKPTEFRSCNILGTFSGTFQHRAIIKGGYINAVSLVSRAYAEFESVKGGSFTYTGDRAFVTRGCSFTTVTLWGPPTFGAYKVGQRTQRIGAMPSGTGVEYVNTTDAGANFVAISTIP